MPIVIASSTGTTVGDLADRVYRDWLHAPEDQPVIITLAADVNASTTTWAYNDNSLAPDEEDLLGPGTIVECGTEQARITDVDDTANSLTVVRGVNGTAKASHSADDDIVVAPVWARHTVVEAVKDNVVALYPSLWHVATEQVTTSATYVEVPEALVTPIQFLWLNGSRYQNGNADVLENFPPSSTNKAVQFYGVPTGKTGYLTYRSKFARPTTESDDVGELGVDQGWERIVTVGAAAQVVGQRPLDRLTAEFVTEQLQVEASPPGSDTDVRNGLLTLRNIWMEEASRSLRAQMQTPVTYNLVHRG